MNKNAFDPTITTTLALLRSGRYYEARTRVDQLGNLIPRDGARLKDDITGLTAASLVAEIAIYFEERSRLDFLVADAPHVITAIQTNTLTHTTGDTVPCLVRARCWYILQYSISLYFRNEYDLSLCYIQRCIDTIRSITPEPFPGTLGHLYFWKGNINRHRQDYAQAITCYQTSMQYVQRHLVSRATTDHAHVDFCLYRMANILALGLGWTYLRSGALSSAKSCLLTAQPLVELALKHDKLRRSHFLMLLAMVFRAEAGTLAEENTKLNQSIRLLARAARTFKDVGDYGHRLNLSRVHYELAVANANGPNQKNLVRAGVHARLSERYAKESEDGESWCLAKLIASRIQRRWLDSQAEILPRQEQLRILRHALSITEAAETKARETGQVLAEYEAFIEQGEVMSSMGMLDDKSPSPFYQAALRKFNGALDRAPGWRHKSVCKLHLARTHLRLRDSVKAWSYFKEYKSDEPQITNGFILSFAKMVEHELEGAYFIIDPRRIESGVNIYSELERELRHFLVRMVQESDKKEDALRRLGVSRQTYFNWKRQFDESGEPKRLAEPS